MNQKHNKARYFDTVTVLDVLAKPRIASLLDSAGADIELVGRWVWVAFATKPADSVRKFLCAMGFRWNRKRGCWQHSCGIPCRHSPGDPRFKYGVQRVETLPERGERVGAA